MKKQMAHGNALSSEFQSSDLSSHHNSEAPTTQTLLPDHLNQATFDMLGPDADLESMNEGKKTAKAPVPMQAASNGFDPRRLLDPKGFDKTSRAIEEAGIPADAQSTLPTGFTSPHHYTNGHAHPEFEFSTGQTKHDQDHNEWQGLGGLIEKAYNIGHREERPQKRQRLAQPENFEEDGEKPHFNGRGGKGGDLGEYVRKKKQEGVEESGAVPNTVVDLTQGSCPLYMRFAYD